MSSTEIKSQIDYLTKFLDLQTMKNRCVRNMSGGQKRRVSLAMALVHSPDLLILDEPTVGVDPLLRQSIWELLMSLSRDHKKTIGKRFYVKSITCYNMRLDCSFSCLFTIFSDNYPLYRRSTRGQFHRFHA